MADRRIDYIALDQIVEWDENPKDHDIPALIASIRRFGFQAPPLLNDQTGVLLAGHGRLHALAQMQNAGEATPDGIGELNGQWLVPVVRGSELEMQEAVAYSLADNRLVELGGWDQENLAGLLVELEADAALEGTGWSPEDLDELLRELGKDTDAQEETFDVEAALETEIEPRIKRGEVWQLGDHRLMCGDSTDGDEVGLLVKGRKADMIFTDPPYGIGQLDMGDDENWLSLLMAFLDSVPVSIPCNYVIFQQPPGLFDLYDALKSRLLFVQLLVWLKTGSRPSSRHFGNVVEYMLWFANDETYRFSPVSKPHEEFSWLHATDVGVELSMDYERLGRPPVRFSPNCFHYSTGPGWMQSNKGVPFDKGLRTVVHPTMKPIGLCCDVVESLTEQKNLVIDGFLGSGSTLIAAEKTGRICYGMEIAPRYSEVAIQRWEDFTGQKAVRVDG